jgi:hypothetical protein
VAITVESRFCMKSAHATMTAVRRVRPLVPVATRMERTAGSAGCSDIAPIVAGERYREKPRRRQDRSAFDPNRSVRRVCPFILLGKPEIFGDSQTHFVANNGCQEVPPGSATALIVPARSGPIWPFCPSIPMARLATRGPAPRRVGRPLPRGCASETGGLPAVPCAWQAGERDLQVRTERRRGGPMSRGHTA